MATAAQSAETKAVRLNEGMQQPKQLSGAQNSDFYEMGRKPSLADEVAVVKKRCAPFYGNQGSRQSSRKYWTEGLVSFSNCYRP